MTGRHGVVPRGGGAPQDCRSWSGERTMKLFVSVDMEGCAGIVYREQTDPKGFDYEL